MNSAVIVPEPEIETLPPPWVILQTYITGLKPNQNTPNDQPKTMLRAPSRWTPPAPSPVVQTYLDNMKHTIFKHTASQSHKFSPEGHPNLSSGELDTLHNLSTKQDCDQTSRQGRGHCNNGHPFICPSGLTIINTLHRLHVIPEQTTRFCIE